MRIIALEHLNFGIIGHYMGGLSNPESISIICTSRTLHGVHHMSLIKIILKEVYIGPIEFQYKKKTEKFG